MQSASGAPSILTPGQSIFNRYPWLADWKVLVAATLVLAVGAAIQQVIAHNINNFVIFRQAFSHLIDGSDLYVAYPREHHDFFKYSPTFALLMAPFRALPIPVGLPLWGFLNGLLPLLAVRRLPISAEAKAFIVLFTLNKAIGSVQNSQSNGIVIALMIGTFVALESRKPVWAALFVCLGFYIKIFGAAAGLLFLLYDGKRRFVLAGIGWGVLLGLAPALVVGIDGLVMEYRGWLRILAVDEVTSLPSSLIGLVEAVRGARISAWLVQLPGLVLLALPLLRRQASADVRWRLMFLALILVWVILFNHQTESPTLVIALFGAAIWGVVEPRSAWRAGVLLSVFVLTGLSSTDLFPAAMQHGIIEPFGFKIWPLVVLMLSMMVRLVGWPIAPPHAAKAAAAA